jgi:hypothetical protein
MSDTTQQQRIEEARVRVRAKKFADRLRSEGWAEFIPEEDDQWLSTLPDDKLKLYKETLQNKGCTQRPDKRWEFKRWEYK